MTTVVSILGVNKKVKMYLMETKGKKVTWYRINRFVPFKNETKKDDGSIIYNFNYIKCKPGVNPLG